MNLFITYDWNTGEPLDPYEWLWDEEETIGGGLSEDTSPPIRKIPPIDIRRYR